MTGLTNGVGTMDLLHVLTNADWTRAARFWLLVAVGVAALESSYHLRGAVLSWLHKDSDHA
jgi:hypothetical protein